MGAVEQMKLKKKLLAVLFATFFCIGLSVPAFAAVNDTGFSDVAADAWYADSVMYMRDNGIMSGTGNAIFSPDDTMTRATLATVLYRAAGSPVVNGTAAFTDAVPGSYYSDALAWASENNIIPGYENGLFGISDPVSREQLATILWRYDGSKTPAASARFTDSSSISTYAVSAVNWAVESGIITGNADVSFSPQDSATRAQAAVMLHRYLAGKEAQGQSDKDTSHVLVAFFSRAGENYGVGTVEKGNTQYIAEFIAEKTGADLFKVETVTPYPVSYEETTAIARQEQSDNARPALSTHVENIGQYDSIFLGYPIWYGDMPMAMNTFLEEYDFTGKTIIPLSTHAGSGFGSSINTIKRLCPDTALLDGFSVAGTQATASQSAVNRWLDGLTLPTTSVSSTNTAHITMTVNGTVITAELADSQTTRDFLALLPRTVTLSRYGDREYYGNPGGTLSQNGEAIADFQNGDVTFYPPSGNLAIFFGNEDSSNQSGLIRMGKITSDLSVFDSFGQSIEMTIAVAQ